MCRHQYYKVKLIIFLNNKCIDSLKPNSPSVAVIFHKSNGYTILWKFIPNTKNRIYWGSAYLIRSETNIYGVGLLGYIYSRVLD